MTGLEAVVASSAGEVGTVRQIEVLESLGEPTRFRYRLPVAVADGDLPALARRGNDPGATITIGASGAALVRGPVTGQRAHLSRDEDSSWVDVLGGDRSLELDRKAVVTSWSAMRSRCSQFCEISRDSWILTAC